MSWSWLSELVGVGRYMHNLSCRNMARYIYHYNQLLRPALNFLSSFQSNATVLMPSLP
jgi:hypothetical protein